MGEEEGKFIVYQPEDLQHIRSWLNKQAHLPTLTDKQICMFLNTYSYSLERTKKAIDASYTIRTHATEFFSDRDPLNEDFRRLFKVMEIVELPKRYSDGSIIVIGRLINHDTSKVIINVGLKVVLVCLDVLLHRFPLCKGLHVILDMTGVSGGHLATLNISSIARMMHFLQDGMIVKLKSVHIVNSTPLLDKILTIIKPFIKSEFLKLLNFHYGKNEGFHKYFEPQYLPNDYGGKLDSMEKYHKVTWTMLMKYRDWLINEESTQRVNESLRVNMKLSTDNFGLQGSFKNLSID